MKNWRTNYNNGHPTIDFLYDDGKIQCTRELLGFMSDDIELLGQEGGFRRLIPDVKLLKNEEIKEDMFGNIYIVNKKTGIII